VGISDKMLSQQLKSLQEMGFVEREVLDETPIKVWYHLSEKGKALIPILDQIYMWGLDNDITRLLQPSADSLKDGAATWSTAEQKFS